MATQPSRIARLFSRREIILASPSRPEKRPLAEMSAREFRILRHLMALGEPTRFELSDSNFIEASGESYNLTNHRYVEATPGS